MYFLFLLLVIGIGMLIGTLVGRLLIGPHRQKRLSLSSPKCQECRELKHFNRLRIQIQRDNCVKEYARWHREKRRKAFPELSESDLEALLKREALSKKCTFLRSAPWLTAQTLQLEKYCRGICREEKGDSEL